MEITFTDPSLTLALSYFGTFLLILIIVTGGLLVIYSPIILMAIFDWSSTTVAIVYLILFLVGGAVGSYLIAVSKLAAG